MDMNCNTALIGAIFGLIMAKKPDVSSLHAVLAFLSLFSMMFFEIWASKKMLERKEIQAIIKGLVFLLAALIAASLYIKIASMDFFFVFFAGALCALGGFYFPTLYGESDHNENVK
jgi:hypothetical protein